MLDFPGGSDGKASVYNVGDPGSSPGLGRPPGEGNGNPLQYYCLENPMERGAWKAAVYGATKSRTRLSDFTSLCVKLHGLSDSYHTLCMKYPSVFFFLGLIHPQLLIAI